jgi:general secretion pathway protein G
VDSGQPLAPGLAGHGGHGQTLDPWGRPYRYLDLTKPQSIGGARKDKRLNPLNTDFDLYSVGKDGETLPPLPPKVSQDDVVRARDGRFIGLGKDFDP